jgi:hypothetical protein
MLNTAPCRWTIEEIAKHIESGPRCGLPGQYRAEYMSARPYGYYSLGSRLSLAWAVFSGKADALFWPGQNPKAY